MKQNPKDIVVIKKGSRENLSIFSAHNLLYDLSDPKIKLSVTQPLESGGHVKTDTYMDIPEVMQYIHNARAAAKLPTETDIIRTYKGSFNKKFNKLISRVCNIKWKPEKKVVWVSIDWLEGEQEYTANKDGEKVKGVVKPLKGGKTLAKAFIALTLGEAISVADMLDKEVQAWRTAMNTDFLFNPDKYIYQAEDKEAED